MTTAVIGTGFIGGILGRAFAKAGLPTIFGSRHPRDTSVARDTAATVTTIQDAVATADTLVLAIPSNAVKDFLRTNDLAGKLIIDATNNVAGPVFNQAATVAKYAPQSRYARAFNSLGGEIFANPDFDGTKADLFYSATEQDRATVEELIVAVGLRPMYLGDNQQDAVDGVLRLYFALAYGQGYGRNLAFHTLTRPTIGRSHSKGSRESR